MLLVKTGALFVRSARDESPWRERARGVRTHVRTTVGEGRQQKKKRVRAPTQSTTDLARGNVPHSTR